MRKAEVTFKEGFRYYRLDNTYNDVKLGDEIDLDVMVPRDAQARIQAGHVKILDAKNTADAKAAADKAAADAKRDAAEKAAADAKAAKAADATKK